MIRPQELGAQLMPAPARGFIKRGLEVALDTEQLLYEATTLLNAASLINRIARQS